MPKVLNPSLAHQGAVTQPARRNPATPTAPQNNSNSQTNPATPSTATNNSLNNTSNPSLLSLSQPQTLRPASRGTPSRQNNHSRGATARTNDNERVNRSVDEADDHIQWLSIEVNEGDSQSFQSVTPHLDASRRREMQVFVERQRQAIRAKEKEREREKERARQPETPGTHSLSLSLLSQDSQHIERQISDITLESDDGVGSDRTTAASYMGDRGSPSKEAVSRSLDLRHMSDEQFAQLEATIRAERMRRSQREKDKDTPSTTSSSFIDKEAVEIRKGLRRSKSGGSDSAVFSRKSPAASSFTNNTNTNNNINTNTSINNSHSNSSRLVEQEDPEVRNAFSAQGMVVETSVPLASSSTPSAPLPLPATSLHQSPSLALRALSRGNGAYHPGDKMFEKTVGLLTGTPSPATNPPPSSSSLSLLSSPTQTHPPTQSPLQENTHFSSRPASRSILHSSTPHRANGAVVEEEPASHNHSFKGMDQLTPSGPPSLKKPNPNNFRSIEGDEEILPTNNQSSNSKTSTAPSTSKKLSHGHRVSQSRELVFSPSSAFDDISLGSQKSLSSARTRESALDLPSPTSTFSKHTNFETKKIASDLPKKAKK